MSARPSELVNWDIDNVNVTRPADPLKNNGYAADAVPTSAELNWVLQFLSAWIAYLDSINTAMKTRIVSPFCFVLVAGNYQSGGVNSTGAALDAYYGIDFPLGTEIVAVRFFIADNVGPTVVQGALMSTNDANMPTTIASANSSGLGANQTLTLAALTTFVAGHNYHLRAHISSGGGGGCVIYGAEIDYILPT